MKPTIYIIRCFPYGREADREDVFPFIVGSRQIQTPGVARTNEPNKEMKSCLHGTLDNPMSMLTPTEMITN